MAYKSKDIDYMSILMNKVGQLCYNAQADTFDSSWNYIRKYTILDDLYSYIKENNSYIPYYVSNEHLNSKIMFITISEHEEELKLLSKITHALGIKDYYRTSYIKHPNLYFYKENDVLNKSIASEIKVVNPSVVVFFGHNIAKWSINLSNIHEVFDIDNRKILATSSMVDILSVHSTKEEESAYKHHIWNDIKQIAQYIA